MKPYYFLHVPRSGGTAIVSNLISFLGEPEYDHINGNPILEDGSWRPFWLESLEEQLRLIGNSRYVCNERRIGSVFSPNHFRYVICIRDPIQQRLALISHFLRRKHGIENAENVSLPLLKDVVSETYAHFPSNLLTWMLASPSNSHAVTGDDMVVARERLRHFSILRLESLSSDFNRVFNCNFIDGLGRHSSSFGFFFNDLPTNYRRFLIESTRIDYELLGEHLDEYRINDLL